MPLLHGKTFTKGENPIFNTKDSEACDGHEECLLAMNKQYDITSSLAFHELCSIFFTKKYNVMDNNFLLCYYLDVVNGSMKDLINI